MKEKIYTTGNHGVVSSTSDSLRQYDKSDLIVGGKNVIESFETSDVVIFNESYTIVGKKISAKRISATYDLTVIGNIIADEIVVNGNLTVIGDIFAKKLTCSNNLICQGDVNADIIFVGSIIANSIKCIEFSCDENALIKTTIDVDESSKTEKTMVACEGIMGAGSFAALNAIANEYFEFTGDIQGKIIELESDTTLSEILKPEPTGIRLEDMSVEEVLKQVEMRIKEECQSCCEQEEEVISQFLKSLSDNPLHTLVDYSRVFEVLTKISYQDVIDDLGDYLMVVYAKSILPNEIYRYETIEHIDTLMLPQAEQSVDTLTFCPRSPEHIAMCIQIAIKCADVIPVSTDIILDMIFSSFGLRYTTVKKVLSKPNTSVPSVADEEALEVEKCEKEEKDEILPKSSEDKKIIISKKDFLNMSISTEAKKFGITSDEQMRLSSAQIKIYADFLSMTERDFKEIFKKKQFMTKHLCQVQQKVRAFIKELD